MRILGAMVGSGVVIEAGNAYLPHAPFPFRCAAILAGLLLGAAAGAIVDLGGKR